MLKIETCRYVRKDEKGYRQAEYEKVPLLQNRFEGFLGVGAMCHAPVGS